MSNVFGQLRDWRTRQKDGSERNSPPRCHGPRQGSRAVDRGILRTRIAEGVARVEDAMVRHIAVATPETSISQAARMMRGRPEGALVVVDGKGLVGIVTISDLLDVLGRRTKRRHSGVAR